MRGVAKQEIIRIKFMTSEERWVKFISELRTYIEEHHHCPNKHCSLYNAQKYYRKQMKEGKLLKERCDTLEEVLSLRRMDEHTGGKKKKYK